MSLKLIHTADWHLGQTFFGYDREAEHGAFLSWLINTLKIQQTDVLLIAGDVFDVANPSASAQYRFFRFLKEANQCCPRLQIVVVAGNHDSAARLEAPAPLLEELHTSIVGLIRRTTEGALDFDTLLIPLYNKEGKQEAVCMAIPYLRQGDYPTSDQDTHTYMAGVARMYQQAYEYAETRRKPGETIIAMGHLHATGAELSDDDRSERIIVGGLESVSADSFPKGICYTALGHIHKAQRVGGREELRYSGSPLPMSFSEKNYNHQVVALEVEDGELLSVEALPVPLFVPLLRIPARPDVPAVVLEQLTSLPTATAAESEKEHWPFLEVQVLLTEPDPGFRHRVEEVLADKAVRLTSILPSYPKHDGDETVRILSYTDLQKIDPLDMLKHTFTKRFGGELPEDMESLFNDVMREVSI